MHGEYGKMGDVMKKCRSLLCVIAAMLLLTGCGSSTATEIVNYNDPSITIASEVGAVQDKIISEYYADANIVLLDSAFAGINDLLLGRYDALLFTDIAAQTIIKQEPRLVIDESQIFEQKMEFCAGIVSDRIPGLGAKFNEFVAELRKSGELEEIISRWQNGNYVFPANLPKAENPELTLRIGTTGLAEPATFVINGEPAGYDVELALRFAAYLNAEPVITLYDWNGLFALAGSDREDILLSNMFKPEVELAMEATATYETSELRLVVKGSDEALSLGERLYRNLIEENRWMDLVRGCGLTLFITVSSVLLGGAIGFGISVLRLWGPKWISTVFRLIEKLITGLPLVIILMYSYFVIFKTAQNWQVAIFTFTLSFTISASAIISAGIDTVGRGQWEGAHALGFTRWNSFMSIIMPQAIPFIQLPLVKAIVGLLLMTSICGYVTIFDLTYAAQMIRARTYDALVPLTIAAILYFLCSCGIYAVSDLLKKNRKNRHHLSAGLTQTELGGEKPARVEADRTKVLISAENVTKAYESVTPIQNLSFEVHEGDVISIIGPSGTGKSTLLRMINGLEKLTAGEVRVNGSTGMVFQEYNLFRHMTVVDNVMYAPMKLLGTDRQTAYNEAMQLLRLVGLSEKAGNYPDELSGGQKQRAAIARTLAMKPDIILFDEPTSALDPTMVWEVEAVIHDLAKAGHTMLIVTHSMSLARNVSNRIFYLDEGGIYEEGTPEQIFGSSAKPKTRAFLYSHKTHEIRMDGKDCDYLAVLNGVANFCERERISEKLENRIISSVEELCIQILRNETAPQILGSLEYRENAKEAVLLIRYSGEVFDPRESRNELALRILLNSASLSHEKIGEGEYTNLVRLTVRE